MEQRSAKDKAEAILGLAALASDVVTTLFGESKAASLASAVINTALAITKALGSGNPFAAIAAGVLGAIQVAKIASTPAPKPADLPTFARGGMTHGLLHSQGGINAELESGEAVLNRRSMANPFLRGIASEINQLGGGG